MTKRELHFSNVLRSRGVAFLITVASVWMMRHALAMGAVEPLAPGMSYAFPPAAAWFSSPQLSMWVNAACVVAVGALLIIINMTFNLLRTMSVFFAAFFMLSVASTPVIGSQFGAHSLLALCGVTGMLLIFRLYNRRRSDRLVFLIFFMLSALGMVCYAALLYVPVFAIGLWQMRILRFKKVLSAAVGLIVPLWIVYGLDILPLPTGLPIFFVTPPTDLPALVPGGWPAIAATAFTIFLLLTMGAVVAFRFLGLNARYRAFNGFLILLSLSTAVFAVVNFTNLPFYLMLLDACLAIQVGHFFRITASRRGYIAMLIAMGGYIGIYFWAILSK